MERLRPWILKVFMDRLEREKAEMMMMILNEIEVYCFVFATSQYSVLF